MRRVVSVTGTRADYGVMAPVHAAIAKEPALELHLIVTGMHLLPEFAASLDIVRKDGFGGLHEVSMILGEDSTKAMSQGIGLGILGIADALRKIEPDLLLLQGDRGEMLAAAICAAHMNIPIVHMSGGDVSGSVDDSVRNAISKLAHIHLTSCIASTDRLLAMGEMRDRIIETGDPAIDVIKSTDFLSRSEIAARIDCLPLDESFIVATLHPVTDETAEAAAQMTVMLGALEQVRIKTILTYPNSDAGGRAMRQVVDNWRAKPFLCVSPSVGSQVYLSLLRYAVAVVGNSSSGLLECPSFKIPVINIGSRQLGRVRADNVIDVASDKDKIVDSIRFALNDVGFREKLQRCSNPYGDGRAAERTIGILKQLRLGPALTSKWKPASVSYDRDDGISGPPLKGC